MHERTGPREVLSAGPPWFGLRSNERMYRSVGGSGWSNGSPRLRLRHRWDEAWVEVETDTASRSFDSEVRRAKTEWSMIHAGNPPSDVEIDIEQRNVELPVDGEAIPFTVLGDEVRWIGFGRVGERTVKVDSRGCTTDEVDLVEVDPEAMYVFPASGSDG